jgi:hypothetical protein
MAGDDDSGRPVPLQSSHGPQPGLEPAVVGLDGVVGVLLHVVERTGQHLVEHGRVDTGPIGRHLSWLRPGPHDRRRKEPPGGPSISAGRDKTSTTWPNWSMARYK